MSYQKYAPKTYGNFSSKIISEHGEEYAAASDLLSISSKSKSDTSPKKIASKKIL